MNIRVSERRYRDSWNSVSTHEAISLNQPIGAESGDPVELGELVADPRAETWTTSWTAAGAAQSSAER